MKRNWCAVKSSRPVVAAAGIALIMASALGAGGPALAARSTGPGLGWPRGLPDPFAVPGAALAGRSGELNGVFCTSADNCWAVGDYTTKTARLNQVLHWTGKKWFKVAVPEPAGTAKGDNDPDRRPVHVGLELLGRRQLPEERHGDPGSDPALDRQEMVRGDRADAGRNPARRRERAARRRLYLSGQLLGGRRLRHRRLDHPRSGHLQPGAALERHDLVAGGHAQPGRVQEEPRQRDRRRPLLLGRQLLGRRHLRLGRQERPAAQRGAALDRQEVDPGHRA